jgi:hypothetical protein
MEFPPQPKSVNFQLGEVIFRRESESDYHEVEVLTKIAFWNNFVQG